MNLHFSASRLDCAWPHPTASVWGAEIPVYHDGTGRITPQFIEGERVSSQPLDMML